MNALARNDPTASRPMGDVRQILVVALLLGSSGAATLSAQDSTTGGTTNGQMPQATLRPVTAAVLPAALVAEAAEDAATATASPWQTVWGIVGLRAIPSGPKVEANGA